MIIITKHKKNIEDNTFLFLHPPITVGATLRLATLHYLLQPSMTPPNDVYLAKLTSKHTVLKELKWQTKETKINSHGQNGGCPGRVEENQG